MLQISKQCLENYWKDHNQFFDSNCIEDEYGGKKCISKYFGDRKYSKKEGAVRSDGQPLEFLEDAIVAEGFSKDYVYTLRNISCVGMTLNCLKEGLQGTGQSEVWNKIRQHVSFDNEASGLTLQNTLNRLGWTSHYWNPAPSSLVLEISEAWDDEESEFGKSRGHHASRYKQVRDRGTYWFNRVDDQSAFVGFGSVAPAILNDMPFWVGTAHTGYHVFPGSFKKVIEAHSVKPITSRLNMEYGLFNPLNGGSPMWSETERYRSGLILLPPIAANPYVKH